MGVWGSGNFDADSPRDFLAGMVSRWERIIDKVLAGEVPEEAVGFGFYPGLDMGEGCLIPTVEIILAVAQMLPCDYLPSADKVREWSERFIRLYDNEIDSLDPSPGHKEARRQAIADTFARLLRLVESQETG